MAAEHGQGSLASSSVVWDGASLPGIAPLLLEPWQTRGTSPVPREAVLHPSRLTASLIQCSLAPAPAETMEGSPPSPAREADTGLRHCPSLDAPSDLPGLTTAVSPELVRCRDLLPRAVLASSPPPAPFSKA